MVLPAEASLITVASLFLLLAVGCVLSSKRASSYLAALTVTRNLPMSGSSRSEILKLDCGPYAGLPKNFSAESLA